MVIMFMPNRATTLKIGQVDHLYIDLDTPPMRTELYKHQYGSDIFDFSVQIVVNGFWFGSIYKSSGPKPDR